MYEFQPTSRREPEGGEFSRVFLGVLSVVVGVVVYVIGVQGAGDARASATWPTVSGIVVSSEVQVRRQADVSTLLYSAHVRYTYNVDGTQYEERRITFGGGSGEKDSVKRKIDSLPVGGAVDVAYDPNDHGRAVLEPGNEGNSSLAKLIGIGAFVLGISMLALAASAAQLRRKNSIAHRS